MALDDADNPLAIEIQQEKAEAYFAACRKMVDALEALQAFDRAVASVTQGHEQITRRSELLEDAAERVYFVVIQREAMNLWCPISSSKITESKRRENAAGTKAAEVTEFLFS
jgi:hypothetical protein